MCEEKREETERRDEVSLIVKSIVSQETIFQEQREAVNCLTQPGTRHSGSPASSVREAGEQEEWLEGAEPQTLTNICLLVLSHLSYSQHQLRVGHHSRGQGHPLLRAPRPQQGLCYCSCFSRSHVE